MKKNVGNLDRILRLVLAVAFVVLYYTGVLTGTLGLVLVVLGAVFALTSFISWCPIYAVIGVNTCPTKNDASSKA